MDPKSKKVVISTIFLLIFIFIANNLLIFSLRKYYGYSPGQVINKNYTLDPLTDDACTKSENLKDYQEIKVGSI